MTQQVFESVWDALEDDPIERANMKLRSALMREIRDWYATSNLTQVEAAKLLHMSRPKLSNLLNGHIHLFTIDRLVNALAAAGRCIELKVAA
jgi:predicted XRE-type DNA-binding protein